MAKQRIIYFILLLIAFLFFIFYPAYLSHLFLLFILFLPLFSLLVVIPSCLLLRCQLQCPEIAVAKGEEAHYTLKLDYPFLFPCASVFLQVGYTRQLGRSDLKARPEEREQLRFPIGPCSHMALHPTVCFHHCGKIDIILEKVRVRDMLGLFQLPVLKHKKLKTKGSIYVMPKPVGLIWNVEESAELGADGNVYSLWKKGDDPSEIFQMREYQQGDRLRDVHWKLSLRQNKLMVKEYGLPLQFAVQFLLDIGMKAQLEEMDRLLDTFASLTMALLQQDIPFSVTWKAGEVLETAPVANTEDLSGVLHSVLSLPGNNHHEVLTQFLNQGKTIQGGHLVYLTTGETAGEDNSMLREALTSFLSEKKGKVTALMTSPGKNLAFQLHQAGCDVVALDDSPLEQQLGVLV